MGVVKRTAGITRGKMASLSKSLDTGAECMEKKPSWARDLSSVGINYYGGVVDNAEEIIEKHKVSTQCSFGTRSSTSNQTSSTTTTCMMPAVADQPEGKENKNANEVTIYL